MAAGTTRQKSPTKAGFSGLRASERAQAVDGKGQIQRTNGYPVAKAWSGQSGNTAPTEVLPHRSEEIGHRGAAIANLATEVEQQIADQGDLPRFHQLLRGREIEYLLAESERIAVAPPHARGA